VGVSLAGWRVGGSPLHEASADYSVIGNLDQGESRFVRDCLNTARVEAPKNNAHMEANPGV